MLLFALLTWLGDKIKGNTVSQILFQLANLTYPVFLVHHWMISRLVRGFDLAGLSRRSCYVFYAIYLLFSFVLAHFLKKATGAVMKVFRGLTLQKSAT